MTRTQIIPLVLIMGSAIFGREMTVRQVEQAARNYIAETAYFNPASGEKYVVENISPLVNDEGNTSAYIANLLPLGFIIFSADESIAPVLAYSNDSKYVGHATTTHMIRADVENWKKGIAGNASEKIKNQTRWSALIDKHRFGNTEQAHFLAQNKTGAAGDSIYYFPTPIWGQGYVNGNLTFNYYTPFHWSTGCVAATMATVLAYYKWPAWGQHSHCYNEDDAGLLCADYDNTVYDWQNTLFQYIDMPTTEDQRKAAGLLQFHTSVSVEMDFGFSGSTAETADSPYAFHTYFHTSAHYKSLNASNFWSGLIDNMVHGRPAILSINATNGAGHAAVLDGYAEQNGYFHMNLGWDGEDNGFYNIQGSWNAGGYSIVNGSTKGIMPNPIINPVIEQVDDTHFTLSWLVSNKLAAQYYQIDQARSTEGPWKTLSSNYADTSLQIIVAEVGNYYYRVRARRDDIWWDWSQTQKIKLAEDRRVTFNVDMRFQEMGVGDSVVVRGNISPLSGNENSPAFTDPDSDLVYSLTLPFDFEHIESALLFRYFIDGPSGTRFESVTRTHVINWDIVQVLDTVYFDDISTGIEKNTPDFIPDDYNVLRNYPNPFNPTTNFELNLKIPIRVDLKIWNILGKQIKTIVQDKLPAGGHKFSWNGKNNEGVLQPSGIYFTRLILGSKAVETKKLILTK